MDETLLRRKMLACWHGKNIGGTLGGPYEGFPIVNHLTFYDPVPEGGLPNDDLELQAMYAAALDKMDAPAVNRDVLADIWLGHMNFLCDEYAVAMRNLQLGIRPPWCGQYDNWYINGMGAAIRSELWACLAPGNPALAAQFAMEDACIDHDKDGVYSEVFFAALESMAFVETDLRKLIDGALAFVPANSVTAEGIRVACQTWDETHDWLACRNRLFEQFGTEFKTDVRVNIPFTVLALLSGEGDFGKTICNAVNCGMDTDCTGATAGSIMGILNPDGIDEKWLAPVGNELVVRKQCIQHLEFPATIEEFTEQILRLGRKIRSVADAPESPKPDFAKYRFPVEYAWQKNLHWYEVHHKTQNWQVMMCDPIMGSIEVPEQFRGNGGQLLLRIPFQTPRDCEYTIVFNSATSNQVYLDPAVDVLHDDRHMLFGRQRLFLDDPLPNGFFSCQERPIIFGPTLGGAPLNQYRRYLPLTAGQHVLVVALEPLPQETRITWGFCFGIGSRLLHPTIPFPE